MNDFVNAAKKVSKKQVRKTVTNNGMEAFNLTKNANLHFFANSGNIVYPTAVEDFSQAFKEDPELAIRNLLNTRDIRGGKGVRNTSRLILSYLVKEDPKLFTDTNLFEKFVEIGRWDDLFHLASLKNKEVTSALIKFVGTSLNSQEKDLLLYKWLPINSKKDEDKMFLYLLRNYLKIDAKTLRKKVTEVRKPFIPEYKFCTRQWSLLDYSQLPSQCFFKNRESFKRNDGKRFNAFLEEALNSEKPEVKAGAIYPHQLVSAYRQKSLAFDKSLEVQWKSLPDFIKSDKSFLPLVDVSGSMGSLIPGTKTSCMDVAVSLGIYASERNKSAFKDLFISFTSTPSFISLSGLEDLSSKIKRTLNSPWGMSTNIAEALHLIVNHATANKVAPEDMPKVLLIFSDMHFDRCSNMPGAHAHKLLKLVFEKNGYEIPQIIWWNLNAIADKFASPVKETSKEAMLVSGYSPSILESVLSGEKVTPEDLMNKVLYQDRYSLKIK